MAQRRPPSSKPNTIESSVLPPTPTSDNDEAEDPMEQHDVDPLIQKARAVRSLQLEPAMDFDPDDPTSPTATSMEHRYQVERHKARIKHWKESPFACGLVEPTWVDQQTFHKHMYGAEETAPDETGCSCCSARICPLFNAGRVGNMVVLRSSHEWVEEVTHDEEKGEPTVRRYTRPRLDCVLGPYWPMLVTVTYPLILGVSGWVLVAKILKGVLHPMLAFGWFLLTIGLIVALAFTGCRDPGILYRHEEPPPQFENLWRWNDQALSYRPRNAVYDPDTAVIVEDFDHT